MRRQPGLDLLRALAIAWVMVFHSYFAGYDGGGVLRWSGWMGVDLFFALSGFLIGTQVLRPLARGERFSLRDFYLRRAFRILPAFLTVLVVYAAFPMLREVSGMRPAWQFLSFSMNLLPAAQTQQAFSHAWSLCVEEHFYLLFPLIAIGLAWRPSLRRTLGALIVLVAVGMLLRGVLWMETVAPLREAGGAAGVPYMRYLYVPTWARLDELLGGVALAAVRCYRSTWWAWLQARGNVVLVLGLLVIGGCMALFYGRRMAFVPNVFGYPLLAVGMTLLVCAAASPASLIGRWRVPGARWLALASYSLYLTHKAVYAGMHRWLGVPADDGGVTVVLLYVLAVLTVGAALHYAVERPFLRLRGRVLTAASAPGQPNATERADRAVP